MIGLAFDCHDGTKEKLRPEQIERALKKIPSLLERTAFSLSFNGVLIGPQFPYVTHDLLVRNVGFTTFIEPIRLFRFQQDWNKTI